MINEWKLLEEEYGLNFVEVLENQTSLQIPKPLLWQDMVYLMGKNGLRAADAMTANLYSKSIFKLLISSDSDFNNLQIDELNPDEKYVFLLN